MPPSLKKVQQNTGPWSSHRILNASSQIHNQDLQTFIATCISGWDTNYSEEEKRDIINSLPPQYRRYEVDEGGLLKCPIEADFLLESPHVKSAIARFKGEIVQGLYEKRWQNQAIRAAQERKQGTFDKYLQEHIDEMFGIDGHNVQGPDVDQEVHDKVDSCQFGASSSSEGEWNEGQGRT